MAGEPRITSYNVCYTKLLRINSIHQETHGALSENGQLIIFTSDRPGGYGGVDLYMSRKLPNGEWGKVINLGPVVNSSKDEESPFLFVVV